MKNRIIVLIFVIILFQGIVTAFLISDQGTDVIEISTGNLTALANLTISIYNDPTAGSLIFQQNYTNAIANGSWNVMINASLEYGNKYYKDYKINGEDLDFDGNERLEIQSAVGVINNISFINFSLLSNYALKNQSETFSGNITTSYTGFFGWIGNLTSRVAKLFVQDVDASGNINVTGNVTAAYLFGKVSFKI